MEEICLEKERVESKKKPKFVADGVVKEMRKNMTWNGNGKCTRRQV